MSVKQQVLRMFEQIHVDSAALEVWHGHWLSNRSIRVAGGFPLPPARLMRRVAGTTDAHRFVWSGRLTVTRILSILDAGGAALGEIHDVLDFGCGCGRLLGHVAKLPGSRSLAGCDTDRENVVWCQDHLSVSANGLPIQFAVNSLTPPLPYSDAMFDLVYSYSVFTHVQPQDQVGWLRELGRLIRPGGWLVFSTHAVGDIDGSPATVAERNAFARGDVIGVRGDMGYVAASNYGVFHPPGAVEQLAVETGLFSHARTFGGLPAPPLDSAGQSLHLWRRRSDV